MAKQTDKLTIEKPFTRVIDDLISGMEETDAPLSMTERVATVRLGNGLEAQVHVTITIEQDDFLGLT